MASSSSHSGGATTLIRNRRVSPIAWTTAWAAASHVRLAVLGASADALRGAKSASAVQRLGAVGWRSMATIAVLDTATQRVRPRRSTLSTPRVERMTSAMTRPTTSIAVATARSCMQCHQLSPVRRARRVRLRAQRSLRTSPRVPACVHLGLASSPPTPAWGLAAMVLSVRSAARR